jgi:hypothetical protein
MVFLQSIRRDVLSGKALARRDLLESLRRMFRRANHLEALAAVERCVSRLPPQPER